MHVRTTARDLARWLEREGGHWHVEGEPALSRSLPVPTPASSLVDVLERRDAWIALLLPEASAERHHEDASLRAEELAVAAHVVDGHRVFQLAWIGADGSAQDSWLLAEQRLVRTPANGIDAATEVLARFRAAKPPSR